MNIYEQQARNRRTTWAIMFVFVALFLAIGLGFDFFYLSFNPVRGPGYEPYADGYSRGAAPPQPVPYGAILALLAGFGMAANSMVNGVSMVLRSTRARRAVAADEKERRFLDVVAEMSTAAGLPVPDAYIVPDSDLNAFAAGTAPESSVIAVTEGLLNSLNREELQAVVSHEMSHIRNYDMRLMTVSAGLLGAIALLSDFAYRTTRLRSGSSRGVSSGASPGGRKGGGAFSAVFFAAWLVLVALAPLISRLLAMAISREREYLADASGAELTRNPQALVSALEKIRAAVMPTCAVNNGVAHMCIADPRGSLIEEKSGLVADLFATHPPMEKRILALKVMAYQYGRDSGQGGARNS
ncbi:MAG: M48 family metallopeptidase [Elusimicrobiales bacterium]